MSEPACCLQLDLHWGSVFASRLRTRVFSVLFSFVNWILSGSWTRYWGLYSQNVYQNQRVLRRLIYIEPVLTRNATYLRTFFLEFFCLSRDFINHHVFLLLDLHWDSPKLPWAMQRTCGPFVLKTFIMPFKRLSVLWHSLIRSLYFIQIYIFIPLTHSAPFLGFSHVLLYTNFFTYSTTRNIFLIPPDDAVTRNLIIIFNFSSQRPHLNYIFLSNVYSFDTMEFSMKHKY